VMGTLRHPVARHLRDRIVHFVMGLEVVQQRFAFRMAELGVNYRHSPIVGQAWNANFPGLHGSGPGPGDRAIDGQVIDAKTAENLRLFEVLRGVNHKLLIFSGPNPSADDLRNIEETGRLPVHHYPNTITAHFIVRGAQAPPGSLWAGRMLLDSDGALHRRYAASAPCFYVIRPDGYVGFRALPLKAEPMWEYLNQSLIYVAHPVRI
ncbi:MAG: hypothetical protein ACREDR_01625, partial [Blastocatellia bacterium]